MAKSAKKAPAKRTRRPKQQFLPGCEPPSIPELDSLAERYDEAKTERMRLSEAETNAATLLEAGMKKHGLIYYEWEGKFARLDVSLRVKTGKKKEPKAAEEGSDGD